MNKTIWIIFICLALAFVSCKDNSTSTNNSLSQRIKAALPVNQISIRHSDGSITNFNDIKTKNTLVHVENGFLIIGPVSGQEREYNLSKAIEINISPQSEIMISYY